MSKEKPSQEENEKHFHVTNIEKQKQKKLNYSPKKMNWLKAPWKVQGQWSMSEQGKVKATLAYLCKLKPSSRTMEGWFQLNCSVQDLRSHWRTNTIALLLSLCSLLWPKPLTAPQVRLIPPSKMQVRSLWKKTHYSAILPISLAYILLYSHITGDQQKEDKLTFDTVKYSLNGQEWFNVSMLSNCWLRIKVAIRLMTVSGFRLVLCKPFTLELQSALTPMWSKTAILWKLLPSGRNAQSKGAYFQIDKYKVLFTIPVLHILNATGSLKCFFRTCNRW